MCREQEQAQGRACAMTNLKLGNESETRDEPAGNQQWYTRSYEDNWPCNARPVDVVEYQGVKNNYRKHSCSGLLTCWDGATSG
jgi:hypothetical protein